MTGNLSPLKPWRPKDGDPADIAEFGDAELAGVPSVASLIYALPPIEREPYREKCRAFVRDVSPGTGHTYREFMERGR